MNTSLDWIIEIEEYTGMELMSAIPCVELVSRGGGLFKGSSKGFRPTSLQDTS